ncbi:MAG: hypothetical protein ACR2MT_09175, partial [Aurantibacter sp.]
MKKTILFLALLSITFSCKKDDPNKTNGKSGINTVVIDSISFNLPVDFELEELYSPSDHEQGSW